MRTFFFPFLLVLLLLSGAVSNTHAQKFADLPDEAEAGGFDLITQITALPVEWKLNAQENGDAYYLKLSSSEVRLFAFENSKSTLLASKNAAISPGELIIQRRGSRWIVIAGHRVVLQAEDDRWMDGIIGVHGIESGDVRLQPVEEIAFDDDFMRVAKELAITDAFRANPSRGLRIDKAKIEEETIWNALSGAWTTTGISEQEQAQVAQSANPFAFASSAKGENFAVAGRPFWSDYSVEAAAKPHSAHRIGVALYVQDTGEHLLFDWQQDGLVRIIAQMNGAIQTLAAGQTEGYDDRNWYHLRFSARDGVLIAFIDDQEVLRARTDLFGRGKVGLFAENADNTSKDAETKTAVFDDLRVRSVQNFDDNFSVPVNGRWKSVNGAWSFRSAASPAGASTALAVTGETDWQEYAASAEVRLPADAVAGLVVHHQKGSGAYLFRVTASKADSPSAGKAQIIHLGAKSTLLAETDIGSRYDNTSGRWKFSTERGYLSASITLDGKSVRILDAWHEGTDQGRAGLYAQRGKEGVPILRNFSVEFLKKKSAWATVPELYVDEKQAETMGGWSTPEGLWLPNPPIQAGTSSAAPKEEVTPDKDIKRFWHKGTFWSDQEIRFRMPSLKDGENLALVFDRVSSDRASSEKILQNQPLTLQIGIEKAGLKILLLRGDENVLHESHHKVDGQLEGQPIEILRRGRYMIVRLGDEYSQRTLLAAKISE